MPKTIFDASAAEAQRRDDELRQVLDEMATLVKRAKAKKPLARARTRHDLWLINEHFEELADLETRYVLEKDAWQAALEELYGVYPERALGTPLFIRASRDGAYRMAALKIVPEFAGRLVRVCMTFRRALAGEVLRAIPGGGSAHALLGESHSRMSTDGWRDWLCQVLVTFWRVTDPTQLRTFAMLPVPARGKKEPDLFAWAAYEVMTWLEAHHPKRERHLEHVETVLAAGGWTQKLGHYVTMRDKVRKAIARETARRKTLGPTSSLFGR